MEKEQIQNRGGIEENMYKVIYYEDEDFEDSLNIQHDLGWRPILMTRVFVPADNIRMSLGGTLDHIETTVVFKRLISTMITRPKCPPE